MLAARQSQGHELALEELNAGTRGTSNRDIFSADMVAATRRNGGTQPSQSATPLKAGMASMCREIIKETVIQGAVYFVTYQKRRVSATCFKRLGTTHVIQFANDTLSREGRKFWVLWTEIDMNL
ncbi:unnamed protein product [Sphagnum jensenii]